MYKKTNSLKVNTIIVNNENKNKYRVLYFENDNLMIVIQLDITKINIMYFSTIEVINNLYEKYEIFEDDDASVVDLSSLNAKQLEKYNIKLNFVQEITKEFGPNFMDLRTRNKGNKVLATASKYNLGKTCAWLTIRRYLQSGMSKSSLLDKSRNTNNKTPNYKSKPGKKSINSQGIVITNEVKKQFQTMLNEYKSNRNLSFALAYDKLIQKYYSKAAENGGGFDILPANERPTLRQFYYYCEKHLSREEMEIIKTSKQEYRNDKRLLFSDSNYMVSGPGDMLEMDAQEMDITIVSEYDRNQIIGRPILYALIDVYTRAIVAVSVGFDNNSIIGMTSCLLNLAEDKNEFLKRNGLPEINLDYWPSNFLPKHIRVDRGSDFVSKKAEKIFNELNIQRVVVPGATGSYKGYIEQLWHQLNTAQNASLYNHGLIEKRYDSTHKEKAVLTMKDVTKIVISQVIVYNQLQIKNFKPTKDMLKKNINPCPCELWKYGVKKHGNPVPILDMNQYAYTLMTSTKGSISRKGICVKGLYYISDDKELINQMIRAGNKKVPFKCRIDTRNISSIYYLENNQLKQAKLDVKRTGQDEFLNATMSERLDYLKVTKALFAKGEQDNQRLRSARLGMIDVIVDNAKKDTPNLQRNNKDVKEKRKEAQMIHQSTNSIGTILLNDETQPESVKKLETSSPKVEENDINKNIVENNVEDEFSDPIEALIQADYQFALDENNDYDF